MNPHFLAADLESNGAFLEGKAKGWPVGDDYPRNLDGPSFSYIAMESIGRDAVIGVVFKDLRSLFKRNAA